MKEEEKIPVFTLMLWFFIIPDGLPHSGCLMLAEVGGEDEKVGSRGRLGDGELESKEGHPVNSTAGKRSRIRQGETTVST